MPRPTGTSPDTKDDGQSTLIREQIKALGDTDEAVRTEAKKQLSDIGQPAIAALTDALKSGKKQVRLAAAETLELMGPAAKGATLALNKALKDEDEDVRAAVSKALKAIEVKD